MNIQAINFTDFCAAASDLAQIKKALEFYNEEFTPEKVVEYFSNWEIFYDNTFYDNGKKLVNTHSNGTWKTSMTINDGHEYVFGDETNGWNYLPKTMSEFISDILRYEDFELLLNEKSHFKIYRK